MIRSAPGKRLRSPDAHDAENKMRDITNIELHQDHAKVEWLELENLFTLTELGGRKGDKLRRAFLNSHAACYVGSQNLGTP